MKKDNIPGLEGYYISRLGTLWSRYHKSGKLTHSEWHKVKPNHNQKGYLGEVLLIQMLNYLKLKEEKLDLDMNLGKRFVD